MKISLRQLLLVLFIFSLVCCQRKVALEVPVLQTLKVSENKRFLVDEKGDPFFWLGDTGWLLFSKLDRGEAEAYLADRAQKGFNVIQVMLLHDLSVVNAYHDSALVGRNIACPAISPGSIFGDSLQYDYWDHVEYLIDKAAMYGIYMGLVPVWGSNVRSGAVDKKEAARYAGFLADRFRNKSNIIWLNGGDVKGSDSLEIWKIIGSTIKQKDRVHLMTFHPFGRTTSSLWFHDEDWLDFNMFQSGHRRYDQDDTRWGFGQDNWKYVLHDYALVPIKPTLDGEPSYEGIPQGLHDTLQPRWTADDIRRYAYWSVFAGAFGFTYGANAVMQFYKPSDKNPSYGPREYWDEAIHLPGSEQMQHLKKLMLSRPYLERIPDASLVENNIGLKYDYLAATRGIRYAFIYTYTGRNFMVKMGKISGQKVKATWFRPIDGTLTSLGEFDNHGILEFDPPGEQAEGNDWVLILDDASIP